MSQFDWIFRKRKMIPQYWLNKSLDLRASAGVIWFGLMGGKEKEIIDFLELEEGFDLQIATHSTFGFLSGLSLELLYKGILVAKRKTLIETHQLNKLADQAGLELNHQEKDLLQLFSEIVVWQGKYPIPREKCFSSLEKFDTLEKRTLFDKIRINENFQILRRNDELTWSSFNVLWKTGYSEFDKHRKPDSYYLNYEEEFSWFRQGNHDQKPDV